jgi:hypothetical protein
VIHLQRHAERICMDTLTLFATYAIERPFV